MMYVSPNVTQYRNQHDLMSDFKSEYEMYIHNENILNFIENQVNWDSNTADNKLNVKSALMTIYDNLLANDVIAQKDIDLLHKWSSYF